MITVKFDRSVKYNGIRYAAHEVFKAEDKDKEELVKAGATILSADPAPSSAPNKDDEDKDQESQDEEDSASFKEKLLEYSLSDLIQFAKDNDIDLQGKTRKADIYNIIVASIQ